MSKEKLTAFKVENVKPRAKRFELWDAGKPGLCLIVQPSGRKSWVVRYRRLGDRRQCKYKLPGFPSLAMAHKLAQEALDKVANGQDPTPKPATTATSVEDGFRQFMVGHTRTKKGRAIRPTTRQETGRLLGLKPDPAKPDPAKPGTWVPTGKGVLATWEGRALADIKRADVEQLIRGLAKKTNGKTAKVTTGGPVAANRSLTALKTCFAWHVQKELLAASPCDGVDGEPEDEERSRVLDDKELAALWRAADAATVRNDPIGRMVQMLILTGCRRDEVRDAPWAEFKDRSSRQWLIPGPRTKNGRDHLVPLTEPMERILDELPRIEGSKLLFTTTGKTPISGLSKCKKRLHDAMTKDLGAEPEGWTLHDIRRTFVTGLQRLRIPVEVAEACVNHVSGSMAGVTRVYARHDYAEEKREALEKWSRHVTAIVEGRPADNVVPMVRGR